MVSINLIENVMSLIPILENRLPKSSNVFNMAKFYDRFKEEMKFYFIGEKLNNNAWIFVIYHRKDFGQDISVSAPVDNPFEHISATDIQKTFETSNLIDWDKKYQLTTIDRNISFIFYELSVNVKGNSLLVLPDYIYYLDPHIAAGLHIENIQDTTYELSTLSSEAGIDLKTTWTHSAPDCDDYLRNLLNRNESRCIVGKDGKIVSGLLFNGNGFLGMLNTLVLYRRKGFGKYCMRSLIKEIAQIGFVPCTSVDVRNVGSRQFQLACGLKESHIVDYLLLYTSTIQLGKLKYRVGFHCVGVLNLRSE